MIVRVFRNHGNRVPTKMVNLASSLDHMDLIYFLFGGFACMSAFVFIAFAALVIVLIVFGAMAAAKRRKALQAWATARGFTFSAARDGSFMDRYPGFHCLRRGEGGRYAFNVMRGVDRDRPTVCFDYHYRTSSTDSKGKRKTHHHYFSAAILDTGLPLRPLLIRPEGFFDKITEFFGADDIDFESAEFSRKFFVKSPDKQWAFDVIHQETMEFLLASPRFTLQSAGRNVIVYAGGTFDTNKFDQSLAVVHGLIDRLPDYLLREMKGDRVWAP